MFYVCIELMLQIDAMFPALLLQSDLQLVEFWREKLLTDVWEELLEYSSTLSTTGTYLLVSLSATSCQYLVYIFHPLRTSWLFC